MRHLVILGSGNDEYATCRIRRRYVAVAGRFRLVAAKRDAQKREVSADLATWQDECAYSREAAASCSLEDTGVRRGEPCSLRWIYVHMIEEYARHNGHADLLREMVDGRVGC